MLDLQIKLFFFELDIVVQIFGHVNAPEVVLRTELVHKRLGYLVS